MGEESRGIPEYKHMTSWSIGNAHFQRLVADLANSPVCAEMSIASHGGITFIGLS